MSVPVKLAKVHCDVTCILQSKGLSHAIQIVQIIFVGVRYIAKVFDILVFFTFGGRCDLLRFGWHRLLCDAVRLWLDGEAAIRALGQVEVWVDGGVQYFLQHSEDQMSDSFLGGASPFKARASDSRANDRGNLIENFEKWSLSDLQRGKTHGEKSEEYFKMSSHEIRRMAGSLHALSCAEACLQPWRRRPEASSQTVWLPAIGQDQRWKQH